jgi:predicted site-specific integrase-resolvase
MNIQIFNRLTAAQVAETLGVTTGTLAVWRCTKRYQLPFVKIGRKIFYRSEDVNTFVESRTFCKISAENNIGEKQ